MSSTDVLMFYVTILALLPAFLLVFVIISSIFYRRN